MNKTVVKGGGGIKRPRKMLVFGHDFLRRHKVNHTFGNSVLDICQKNVDFVGKKGGRGGGQKVMTVLFIRENIDNYGRPLTGVMLKVNFDLFYRNVRIL